MFLSLPVFAKSPDSHSIEFKISIRIVTLPWSLDDYLAFLQFSPTSRSNEFDIFLKYMLDSNVEWYGPTGLGTMSATLGQASASVSSPCQCNLITCHSYLLCQFVIYSKSIFLNVNSIFFPLNKATHMSMYGGSAALADFQMLVLFIEGLGLPFLKGRLV